MNIDKDIKKKDEMEELFSNMHSELTKLSDRKNKITLSKFQKFTPLFREMSIDEIPAAGSAEFIHYQNLSFEYSQTVNIQNTVDVIDDNTGEIVFTILPTHIPTKLLTTDETLKNVNFQHEASHDFPGVAEKAHAKLQAGFIISQELKPESVKALQNSTAYLFLVNLNKVNPEKVKEILKDNYDVIMGKIINSSEVSVSTDSDSVEMDFTVE